MTDPVLRGLEVFRAVPDDVLASVSALASRIRLDAGATLFAEGDPGDALFAVASGRLRAFTPIGPRDVGPGGAVGELALLLGSPRTATVKAVRDSEVVRVPASVVDVLVERAPRAMVDLAALVAGRLTSAERGAAVSRVRTAAVVHVDAARTGGVVRSVATAASARVVSGPPDGVDDARLGEWLDEAEAAAGLVLLEADPRVDEAWARRAVGQADVVLVVADASVGGPAGLGAAGGVVDALRRRDVAPRQELVLVQSGRPRGTAAWRALGDFAAHHHVGPGEADSARLARHLLGRSVGLVLSGGGARAFAHIGVVRALREAGVPIDLVAGSSIGSVVGAQVAAGWTPEQMLAVNEEEWNKVRIDRDFTLPVVSLLSTRGAKAMFDRMFGDLAIEDLWLNYFCTVVDLTTCELLTRRAGSVATWVRASASPPALWPPVVDEAGHLFIDGGVLDNVPTALLRAEHTGPIVTSNVSPPDAMSVEPGDDAPDGLRDALSLLARRRRPFPNIGKIIYRTAVVTSLSAQEGARQASDLYIEPPVRGYSLTAYKDIPTLERLGYEAAATALTTHPPPDWRT